MTFAVTDIERIEVGQSGEDEQRMNDELSSNVNQEQQQVSEDILNETDTFRPESADNGEWCATDKGCITNITKIGITSF